MTPEVLNSLAAISSAYFANNAVNQTDIRGVINEIYASITTIGQPEVVAVEAPPQEPAVPIKRSVTPDYIVCLEDGVKLKVLKRHLRVTYGMSVEEYRQKWGLPSTYPSVAANYAKARSELAKKAGLGIRVKAA